MRLDDGRKINLFAVTLSLIVPGAGEFYLGVPGRALFILLLRIAVLLFIPMFVFDSLAEPQMPFFAGVFIFFAVHFYSAVSAAGISRKIEDHFRTRGSVRGCCLFTIFHIISVFLCAMFFLSCITPVKLKIDAYPAYSKGDYVFAAKRNSSGYLPGDLVVTGNGAVVRIICVNESFAEYSGGMFTVDGALCPQIPPLENSGAAASGFEEIFSESIGGGEYLIAREKIAGKMIQTFAVKNGEILAAADDRRKSEPEIIQLSSIKGSISGIRPILRRGKHL